MDTAESIRLVDFAAVEVTVFNCFDASAVAGRRTGNTLPSEGRRDWLLLVATFPTGRGPAELTPAFDKDAPLRPNVGSVTSAKLSKLVENETASMATALRRFRIIAEGESCGAGTTELSLCAVRSFIAEVSIPAIVVLSSTDGLSPVERGGVRAGRLGSDGLSLIGESSGLERGGVRAGLLDKPTLAPFEVDIRLLGDDNTSGNGGKSPAGSILWRFADRSATCGAIAGSRRFSRWTKNVSSASVGSMGPPSS